jgi:hypothetical protein
MIPIPKRSKPNFREMLLWLMTEVIYGRTYFAVVTGLRRADPAVLATAPRFFALTRDAHADLAVMTAARIFDEDRRSISIHTVLAAASQLTGSRSHGTEVNVRKVVAEAKASIHNLRPILKAVRVRRNQSMAHSAATALIEPEEYVKGGHLRFRELEGLFDKVAAILSQLAEVNGLPTPSLHLPDAKDYEHALDLIADTKCAQAEAYEKEHGKLCDWLVPEKFAKRGQSGH